MTVELGNAEFVRVMSDGNKCSLKTCSIREEVTAFFQIFFSLAYLNPVTEQSRRLPFEEMGNLLLDAMQGVLICLDNHHIIVDVSTTVKRYLGFEQVRRSKRNAADLFSVIFLSERINWSFDSFTH